MKSAEPSKEPGEPAPIGVAPPESPEMPSEAGSVTDPELKEVKVPAILLEADDSPPAPEAEAPAKFSVGAAGGAPPQQAPPAELPAAYGTGRLLLMARDPGCLYAYWDLTEEQQNSYAGQSVDQRLQVRVHQENLGGPVVSELQVQPQSQHGFITVGSAGTRYVAELGYQPPESGWRRITTSEAAVTPAETPTDQQPVRFGTLDFGSVKGESDPVLSKGPPGEAGTGPQQERGDESTKMGSVEEGRPGLERRFPLPPPLRRLSTRGEPRTEDSTIGQVDVAIPEIMAFEEAFESPGFVPAPTGEWTEAQERALEAIIGRSLLRREWVGSAEIEELIRGEFRISPAGGVALEEAGVLAPPISSAAFGQGPPAERGGFWLNVNAELVIYGATEPDARVTVGGQPIRLREDGTFSCRFALPDGFYQLAVSAISKQGEMRQAELDFSRATTYSGLVGHQPQDADLKPPRRAN